VGNVATRGMPLIEALLNARAPLVSGPQWLAEQLLHRHRVLAVAGTHGKTTTSSILAWILEDAGLSPSFLIGGVPENFSVSARLSGAPFVMEADEYDTAFFDKRSKFLHYRAEVAVLNNLEFDHADIFPDLAAIETQFHHWLRTLPGHGRLVVNAQEPALARVLARGVYTPVELFHRDDGWSIGPATPAAAAASGHDRFELRHRGCPVGEVESPLTGEHNRSNAIAAIAAAVAYGVPTEAACSAVARFKGVKRRLQVRGEVNGVRVLDDFAHHPTAIATTIAGLRDQRAREGRTGRVLAVIEPRSNTMKLGVMAARLADSLRDADHTFAFGGGIDWDLAGALAPLGARAVVHSALAELIGGIVDLTRPGDDVLIMSNGGFGGLHDRLLQALVDSGIGGSA
jgi:UDP-N-acetylmuramate: L-alanyl-gamma-D-glutamyl-meso-diaminopimelate ligase